jgi:ribosomal protein S18 acetylase RimI-like enzyme
MDLSLNVVADGPNVRGSILRTNQAFCELVSTKTTLDFGIAFAAPQFATVGECNQFREVWVESPEEAIQALAQADAHFADAGVACNRWAIAEDQKPETIEPILIDAGFRRDDRVAMALDGWPSASDPNDKYRVLPARAMRAAFAEVCGQRASETEGDARVEADHERLDDHRLDAFVLMDGKVPTGICSLFQVGDIGRIIDLFVVESLRRKRAGTEMANHLITLARRLTVSVVCLEVRESNEHAIAFLKQCGFVEAGRLVEFVRDPQNH